MSSCITDELEAIEAVLCEDYKFIKDIKDNNYTHCFEAFIFPCQDLNGCHCSAQLLIKIPTKYPNIIPSIQILSKDGISESTANSLLQHLDNTLNKQLKQDMLYNIIHLTKEYLKQYNFIGADVDIDEGIINTANPNYPIESDQEEGAQHTANNNDNNVEYEFGFDGEDDDDFNDDGDGWDDINEYEDDATFNKSLQSIEKIMQCEQKKSENTANQKKSAIKYDILTLEEVMDDDISSSRLLAVGNIYELVMSDNDFYGEYRKLKDGSDKYEIRIGVKMCKYIESETLLNVLGLWGNDYMVIRFEFANQDYYINNATAPKIIEIGKSVPHKQQKNSKKKKQNDDIFQPIKLKNKLQSFMGGRSVMNRINNKLFAKIWPPTHLHKYYPTKYKQILQLMALTNYNYNHCKMVLDDCKSYEKALVYLSQPQPSKAEKKEETQNITNTEIASLCNKLITYGISEILQNKKDETKENEELKNECNQCIEYQLQKFLRNACDYFEHNILIQILYFSLYSVLTLSKRCLVCDVPFPSYSGLIKPTVCSNTLCLYGYEELEIGLDIAAMIKDTPEIIDLLITFFYISVKKGKLYGNGLIDVHGLPPNEHINFRKQWKASNNPYVYQDKKPKQYNVLDTDKLTKVINKIPSIDTLLTYAKKGGNNMIKKSLSFKSPLLWPLLRWIVVTNRSYLQPLRNRLNKFDALPSCFQFKFISYSPEREYMFKQLSVKNNNCGYRYAWHGSPMSNWHSILRNGLKNMSNTKHMKNGAAFGRGIYLAPHSGTSYWYSEPSKSDTWPLSMFNKSDYYGRNLKNNNGHGLYCLALCEILNHPKLKSPEPYYVVPTESWVMIRYLFVFNTVDNKVSNHWTGKGRYFDIDANKCIQNYIKKTQQVNK